MPLVPSTGLISFSNIISCMGGTFSGQPLGGYRSGGADGSLLSGLPTTTSSISFSQMRGRGIIGNVTMTALFNGLPSSAVENVVHFNEIFDTSNLPTNVSSLLQNNFSNIYFMDATSVNPAYHYIDTSQLNGKGGLTANIVIRYPTFSNTRKLNIMYGTSNHSGSGYLTFDKFENFTSPLTSQWAFQNSNYSFNANGLTFTNSNFAWFTTGIGGTQRISEATVTSQYARSIYGLTGRFNATDRTSGSNGWFFAVQSSTRSNVLYNFTLANSPMIPVLSNVNASFTVPINSNVNLYAYQSGSYLQVRPNNVAGTTSLIGYPDISIYNNGNIYGMGVLVGSNVTFKDYRLRQYGKNPAIDTYTRTITYSL